MRVCLFFCEKEGRDYLMRSVGAWLPALKQSEALPPRGDMVEEPTQVRCNLSLN